jgi:hypothetical protein
LAIAEFVGVAGTGGMLKLSGLFTNLNNAVKDNFNSIFVFPNPSKGQVSFALENGIDNKVEVYNIAGQKVYENNNITTNLVNQDFSAMPKGIYTVRVTNNKTVKVSKFILE